MFNSIHNSEQTKFTSKKILQGLLLLDKPIGISSNNALTITKKIFRIKKAGHTGTLDPLASGLLPICFGEATKFSQNLLNANKKYIANIKLGIKTSTGDAEGQVILIRTVNCTESNILSVLKSFCGNIMQIPPMYSALKLNGKPLYKYAREGKYIERVARPVVINILNLLDIQWGENPTLLLDITCSKGTYIRTLIEDIGEALGCGAYLNNLRRVIVGNFSIEKSISLNNLLNDRLPNQYLQPIDTLISGFPLALLSSIEVMYFCNGRNIHMDIGRILNTNLMSKAQKLANIWTIRIYSNQNNFLGIALYNKYKNILSPKRLISF